MLCLARRHFLCKSHSSRNSYSKHFPRQITVLLKLYIISTVCCRTPTPYCLFCIFNIIYWFSWGVNMFEMIKSGLNICHLRSFHRNRTYIFIQTLPDWSLRCNVSKYRIKRIGHQPCERDMADYKYLVSHYNINYERWLFVLDKLTFLVIIYFMQWKLV